MMMRLWSENAKTLAKTKNSTKRDELSFKTIKKLEEATNKVSTTVILMEKKL